MLSLESYQSRNVFPTDDDNVVLDLEGLTFETVTNASQNNKQDVGDVRVGDDTMKDVNVGVCGGESMNEVVGEQNDSHGDFPFVSMTESDIAAITQNYHTNKKVKNEKVTDLKSANSRNLLDDDFFVNLSDSTIAAITQVEKVGAASTKGEEHEQATKDVPLETITISAEVALGTKNLVNEFVISPPTKDDIVQPQAGQVVEEVSAKVMPHACDNIIRHEACQVAEEVPANETSGVKDSEVGPSGKKSWG
ncbi:hypothetical protein K7X08_026191 [Anisodus acutangulus]|uniref:Uncharacterized protein n=1 Tax=Anisodus acutangulus TaxID=402998 RepID=A0A9Q1RVL7_9SOLA|nr:hypothetical protein K7X08_026191 [Anisodus acutangulus]